MSTYASKAAFAAASMLAVLAAGTASASPASTTNFVPFSKFVQGLNTAHLSDFARRSDVVVRDQIAFEEMRHYLINMYGTITVKHSFAMGPVAFDCVRELEQPSARAMHLTSIATPPPAPPQSARNASATSPARPALCAAGTIPMRRITLDDLSRFATLHDFFRKDRAAAEVHNYAHGYQSIKSYGGYAIFNVWKPAVNTSKNQIFALSQLWIEGDETTKVQTAETGWQVYPAQWGVSDPVIFVYWTADAYNKTGCYNLTCAGFVQQDQTVALGAPIAHSTDGGKQKEQILGYYLYNGNWWLWADAWVGYYPATQYGKGQMSKKNDKIDFGGEVDGKANWSPMGSGAFPNTGYEHAAYIRKIWSLDDGDIGTNAVLTYSQPVPSCYKISASPDPGDKSWSKFTYFYFGGPGGSTCK